MSAAFDAEKPLTFPRMIAAISDTNGDIATESTAKHQNGRLMESTRAEERPTDW
jgi:hypothetical protein